MTSHGVSGADAQGAVKAYEALRLHVLAGANNAGDVAVMVLMRQGIAGWMARRVACAGPPPAAARASIRAAGEGIHAGVVRVLASMALAAQQEICA